MKIKSQIAALLLLLLSAPASSRDEGWVLVTPDLRVTETAITPTKNWVVLESFATALQCNQRRSSLIRDIAKERDEIRLVDHHTVGTEANRELKLLLHIYTYSKCVSSL